MNFPTDAPALAEYLKEKFLEFDERIVAVSGDSVTADNMPKLPVILLINKGVTVINHQYRGGTNGTLEAANELQIEFWLPPERYKARHSPLAKPRRCGGGT